LESAGNHTGPREVILHTVAFVSGPM